MNLGETYFDGFEPGSTLTTMRRTVTEADLVGYVQLSGLFEEIWLDAGRSRAIGLGTGRAVPGGLTFAMAEGLLVLTGAMRHAVGMLGVDEVRWVHPVCCGDTLRCEVHVESARITSKPGRGVVAMTHRVLNQDDQTVLSYKSARLIATRPGRSEDVEH